jgi:hypothetical protein
MKMQTLIRLVVAALLGIAAAVLISSCGSSGTGLIPAASAGPLQNDFEAVAKAAAAGNGSCAETESALGKTEQDFLALPASIDKGLRRRLQQGISNLRKQARAMCLQLTPGSTSTTGTQTSTTTTPTTNTETTPPTTSTTTTPTTTTQAPTTTTPQGQNGGTEALEGHGEESPGKGEGKGKGKGDGESEGNGGASAGGASAGGGQ